MITKINNTPKGNTFSAFELDEMVEMLRSGAFADEVKEHRNMISILMATNSMPLDESSVPSNIPEICFAALWKKTNGQTEMRHYNGLIMLEVSNLPSADEAARLRKEAARIPYTRLAFIGLTGRDLVIVCAMKAEDIDKIAPEKVKVLHSSAYKRLHYLYSSQLLISLDNKKPGLESTCRMSCDPDAYYNPKSEACYVNDQDAEVPVFRNTHNNLEPQFCDGDAAH